MFRILSLDGGGIKGAFSASVLAALEHDTGKAAADYFDLITGTSTGGIIALGLGLGKSAQDIVEFYREHGPTIFPGFSLVERTTGLWRQLWGPKHSHDVLREALTQVLGDKRFGGSKCRLHRIDVVVSPGLFSLDDVTAGKIEQFIQHGRGGAVKRANSDVVQSRFLNDTPAAKFDPLYR